MKLSTLRYFISVAQYGNYTRASESLYISQPTLSRQIQELEIELGVQLFIRDKKSLLLTDAGKLLLSEAIEIVERCDRLPELFRDDSFKRKKVSQVVKVGYQNSFNMQEIYPIIQQIRQENPDSDFVFQQCSSSELKQGLQSDRFDVVFALKVYFENMPGINAIPLLCNRLKVVVPRSNPLAKKEYVKFSDLKKENFILIHRQNAANVVDYVISNCIKSGFSPNATHYINNLQEALESAALGKGITFVHSGMQTNGMEEKYNVRFLDIYEEDEAVFEFSAIYKKKNKNSILRMLLGYLT